MPIQLVVIPLLGTSFVYLHLLLFDTFIHMNIYLSLSFPIFKLGRSGTLNKYHWKRRMNVSFTTPNTLIPTTNRTVYKNCISHNVLQLIDWHLVQHCHIYLNNEEYATVTQLIPTLNNRGRKLAIFAILTFQQCLN